MAYERVQSRVLTPTSILLLLVMAAGAATALYRLACGLGAATNLNDTYPWGLWIGVDVLCGVALAAGGFTTAALVYVAGGEKYHGLARPAVLTGLLGYAFVGMAIFLDIAIPWHIWHPIIYWPRQSVMFEVAWCVMLYLTVLALEFAPVVLEGLGWGRVLGAWEKITPAFSVGAIALFTGLMSHSWVWAGVALLAFGALAAAAPKMTRARPPVPLLLVTAGVVFSTMHQSSLGSIFLLMPDKLDPLWWTPLLPVNFFLSAVYVGFAMVIFEATLSARAFRRPVEKEALAGLGRLLSIALLVYLVIRLGDVAVRGQLGRAFAGGKGGLFLIEILLGVLLPMLLLAGETVRRSTGGLFASATLAVLGVVFNRLNVALLGMTLERPDSYFPSILEFLVTLSMVAAMVFFFSLAVKLFPVFARHEGQASPAVSGTGKAR